MTKEEKYYKRTYSLLTDLTEAYSKGYSKEEIEKLHIKIHGESYFKPTILNEKREGLLLTIIIALLGINKESIDQAKIVNEYKDIKIEEYKSEQLKKLYNEKLKELAQNKSKSSAFDSWLNIIKSPDIDMSNNKVFKIVRNGLLHSNFYLDTDLKEFSSINIKIQKYYEANIFTPNFHMFIMTYFSNLPSVGLSEKTIIKHLGYNCKIKNQEKLKKILENLTLIKINYDIENYDGSNSLGHKIFGLKRQEIKGKKIEDELQKAVNNGIKINDIERYRLEDYVIEHILNYFELKYGDEFYKKSETEKKSLIICYIEYIFENKRYISNWLIHFYYVINHSINPEFNINDRFFQYDKYSTEGIEPALAILKAYLILYRLQNKTFVPINYKDINFDFNGNNYYYWSEKDGKTTKENYFLERFNKKRKKDTDSTEEEIKNSIICEVIRNGLAHGHVRSFISDKDNQTVIEIKDINPKNNHARCIQMTIDKFNKFLSSEAFLPKNCINLSKEDETIKRR